MAVDFALQFVAKRGQPWPEAGSEDNLGHPDLQIAMHAKGMKAQDFSIPSILKTIFGLKVGGDTLGHCAGGVMRQLVGTGDVDACHIHALEHGQAWMNIPGKQRIIAT